MSKNGKASWKDSYIIKAIDLIHYQIYKDGLELLSASKRRVANQTGLSLSSIYYYVNQGRNKIKQNRLDCPTLDKIFGAFDPVLQQTFRQDSNNRWEQTKGLVSKSGSHRYRAMIEKIKGQILAETKALLACGVIDSGTVSVAPLMKGMFRAVDDGDFVHPLENKLQDIVFVDYAEWDPKERQVVVLELEQGKEVCRKGSIKSDRDRGGAIYYRRGTDYDRKGKDPGGSGRLSDTLVRHGVERKAERKRDVGAGIIDLPVERIK
jgi:hypothetical protein